MWKDAEVFLLSDRYVAPLVKKYGHCTLKPRQKKYYFEDLVDAIVQQQLSMKAASAIFNRLKEVIEKQEAKYEKELKNEIHKWRNTTTKSVEITAGKLIVISDTKMRTCGLSRPKVVYLKDLSQRVHDKRLKITLLHKLSDDEIIKNLTEIKGIGEWTAHMFLMFTLCRPDIFPSGDLGLRNAFSKVIKKGLDQKQMEKFALRWKPFRTIASWYIWKTLENN